MQNKTLEVLLVEDSLEDVDLVKEVFEEEHLEIRLNIVYDGEEALRYLNREGFYKDACVPEVIILDLNLPKKRGEDVLKEIHENEKLKEIPVIILTTSQLDQDFFDLHRLNPSCYIKKDSGLGRLITVIRDMKKESFPNLPLEVMNQAGKKDQKMRLLIVEDNLSDAELLMETLSLNSKYQWSFKHVDRLEEALRILSQEKFDVVLLDLFLPDSYGFDTLTRFRLQKRDVPVIIVTGLDDEQAGVESLRRGAQDYLVKGKVSEEVFLKTILYAIERQHLERVKEELISYVNHELSNPLAVTKEAVSQIVEGIKGPLNEDQKHFLNIALNNITRLQKIVAELLDSTRLDFGKFQINKQYFNFVEMVEEIVSSSQASVEKKGIVLKKNWNQRSILVFADRDRIAQVLSNLLDNALKFTTQGSIEVIIKVDRQKVICMVSDTGPGIAEDRLPHIFQKFSHGDSQKGLGLGLYVAHKIIELHEGEIAAESKVAQGTRISFSIPQK
ncbi:MAG: response regulator [Candidatus Omnitrophica bacterium]|nr:response regulator [Candidatus Omnitrophota bacterium]